MRVDRFRKVEPVEGFERPMHIPLDEWAKEGDNEDGKMLEIKAYVNERGMNRFELVSLFGKIKAVRDGRGVIETGIPVPGVDFYASRFLSVGTDVVVESPPELVEAMRRRAKEVVGLYGRNAI